MNVQYASSSLSELFLQAELSESEIKHINTVFNVTRKIKRGDYLFNSGDKFKDIFTIRAGLFKTSFLSSNGYEQVTGFGMRGEILGLDGIATSHHSCIAIALEDSEVYVIDFNTLLDLSLQIKNLQRNITRRLSSEIVRHHKELMVLGSMLADERVAVFLLDLSTRLHARGYSKSEFILKMNREEIASLLGMKHETLTRTLSKFTSEGIIDVQLRTVKIFNFNKLRSIVKEHVKPENLNLMRERTMVVMRN